ncbi:hypothetical protein Q428_12585 [Fervidicella metallireducens AeB]|uniref:Uncharacterized protein n=1 Tax=Fervidicella metallireducens AeB TaxID=1403537 RepID=A0A017RSH6_9CLOT|nr:hypothetical protein [Fervidicella metallireducens]EYE87572.1 hypothetical protein Q428_12585 [Fervidicella metallireducens AeB]
MQTDVFGVTWDSNTSFIPNTDRFYYSWKVQKNGYPNGYPANGTFNRIPASGTGGLAYTFSLSECYKNGVFPLYDDGNFSVRLSFEANPANAISGYCNYTFTYAHQQSKISTSSPSIDLKSGGLSITPTVTTHWDYAFIDGRIKR